MLLLSFVWCACIDDGAADAAAVASSVGEGFNVLRDLFLLKSALTTLELKNGG